MKDLKELFVSYELAVIAKEAGFDEPCLGIYLDDKELFFDVSYPSELEREITTNDKSIICAAPLYQQIVDWLREEHNIHIQLQHDFYKTGINYNWQVLVYDPTDEFGHSNKSTGMYGDNGEYPTYYSALTAALEEAFKLI